jgi:DNA-binding NtrC family response regulator
VKKERSLHTVAVVDDDASLRRLARLALERAGYRVVEAGSGAEAVELAGSQTPPDAMILDVRMPGMGGLEAFELAHAAAPSIAVIFLTAFIDVRDAVNAIKRGARDYLEKPIDLDELVTVVDEALGVDQGPAPAPDDFQPPEGVVAESPAMRMLFQEAKRVAETDVTALILGESGSGKEILAQFIHHESRRANKPFVVLNCGALPENLIESELFGHERGAFTGAVARRAGAFEQAADGTLFLDEIGEMPLALQPKLLRVLEAGSVRRVGGNQEFPVNVRVVAATNRPLERDAREGRFREDLLFRINVVALRIPPLRERPEDILPLALHFLRRHEKENASGGHDKKFSPAAIRALQAAPWPGNVRELRNAVIRSSIISRGSQIMPEDLPEAVAKAAAGRGVELEPAVDGSSGGPGSPAPGSMEEIEKRAILEALEKCGGNKSQAARELGISRRKLIYKLRSWGM